MLTEEEFKLVKIEVTVLTKPELVVVNEPEEYTEMLEDVRSIALERMIKEEKKLNAVAVVSVRRSTAEIMASAAVIHVYGPAVKLQ